MLVSLNKVQLLDLLAVLAAVLLVTLLVSDAAAAPKGCTRDELGTLAYRLSQPHMTPTATADGISEALYRDLGELKRIVKQRDNAALMAHLADREGLYDWISTEALGSETPPYLWLSRRVDCLYRRSIRRAVDQVIEEWQESRITSSAELTVQATSLKCGDFDGDGDEECYLAPPADEERWFVKRFDTIMEDLSDGPGI